VTPIVDDRYLDTASSALEAKRTLPVQARPCGSQRGRFMVRDNLAIEKPRLKNPVT
jgi:hypothetical protein